MKRIRRPSPALVIACVALFIALGGTGYAVIKLPRNSVGTKHLKKNAVTSPKVKNNAITGADVNEATLGMVPNAGALDGMDSTAFTRSEGLILVSAPWTHWVTSAPNVNTVYLGNEVTFNSTTGFDATHFVHLTPELPVALYGKRTRILGAELCYDATHSDLYVDTVSLRVATHRFDADEPTTAEITDPTDRSDKACRRYMFPAPVTLTEEDSVAMMLAPRSTGAVNLFIGRTTFILDATATAATAPS
jgi:hypothetical protein